MSDIREVFVSYHERSAGELAAKIAERLEGAGMSCWYAKRDLPKGGDFADYIPPQIYGCKVFLLILNKGATHSKNVENEVGLAFRRYNKGENIAILPYQVEKCDFAHWLDYYLIHIQIVSSETTDMGALAEEIARRLGREAVKHGDCGDGVEWTYKDGILTISRRNFGNGTMGNFYEQRVPECVNTPWWSEREKIRFIIIENGVTNIGDMAFYGCSALTNVNIPDSVINIGASAFSDCGELTNVNIPDSVISIGACAFWNCRHLTSVNIPDSIVSIEFGAFSGCPNFKSVSVPANVKIGYHAFGRAEVIRREA